MFKLRFFGSFAAQRRQFLASNELAPVKLHPLVEAQLALLEGDYRRPPYRIATRSALFRAGLGAVRPLVLASASWNAVSALVVLGGVLASRSVMDSASSLSFAFFLSTLYLVSRVIQAAIDCIDIKRRAQLNRGIQMFLFRVVNRKIAVIDPTFTGGASSGQLKTLIGSDVESVEDFLSAAVLQWVPTLVMIFVLGPALYLLAGMMGMLALALALLSLPVAVLGARLIERSQGRAQSEQDSLTTLIGEWVRNIRLVRFLGWQNAIEEDVSRQMRNYSRETAIKHAIGCVVYGLTWSWWMVPVLGMIVAASFTNRPFDLKALFSTLWILDHLMNYIQHIPYSLSLYGAACAGADRILDVLKAPEITRGLLPRGAAPEVTGSPVRVHLSNVTVAYGETRALDTVSAVFDLRSRTAIVGTVGAGKSTLLEVLIGERIPSTGQIEVEFDSGERGPLWREDIYERYRRSVAYSPQQPFLSNTLMRYNIDLGGGASKEELDRAADHAQLAPDLALLARGYDEEVGETGINLSGGQKQRVSLSRVFISKRPLFVLDDPLSAVDPATEGRLMDSILSSSEGLVLVSHRLSELSRCDRIVVLGGGKIVEDGTPEELTAEGTSRFSAFLSAVEDHGG